VNKQSIAIFIPTFNEEATITEILSRIPKKCDRFPVDIYVMDDCSTDRTAKLVRDFGARVAVMPKNSGVGAVTRAGLARILKDERYHLIVKLDADGQHEPELIHDVVGELLRGAQFVSCSRFQSSSTQYGTPLDRYLLNRLFADLIRDVTKWDVTDARTGYMGFDARILKNVVPTMILNGYGVPMELFLRIWQKHSSARHVELMHPARYDVKVDSKYSLETYAEKGNRLSVAFQALLTVLHDIGLDSRQLATSWNLEHIGMSAGGQSMTEQFKRRA
jgi:glycosyltransferase involved in cell wall biosynthesis